MSWRTEAMIPRLLVERPGTDHDLNKRNSL